MSEQAIAQRQKERTEKLKWTENLNMMRNKAHLFKRDIDNMLNNPRMSDVRSELVEMYKSEVSVRTEEEKEKQRLSQFLNQIKLGIRQIKELIAEAQDNAESLSPVPSGSDVHVDDQKRRHEKIVHRLRLLMEQTDSSIMMFKEREKERIEVYNAEEKLLNRDLDQFYEKMNAWEQESNNTEESKSVLDNKTQMKRIQQMNKRKLLDESVPVQVIDFETFVQENGGMTGGWDEKDHAHFLRIRAKTKGNIEQLATLASQQIPEKDYISVKEHEEFYQKLLEMTERKRIAIKQWRDEKEREKIETFENIEEQKLRKLAEYEEQQKQKAETEKLVKKRLLEAWKEQKEKETREEEEQRKLARENEERRKELLLQKKKEEARIALEEYKKIKEDKQRQERKNLVQEVSRVSRPISPGELERMKQREDEHINRIKELKNRKIQQEQDREERIRKLASQVRVEVERDSSRVLRPTSAQKSRELELRKEGPDNKSRQHNFDIRRVQHRIQPSWRQS